jgi:hypothetical protein
MRNANYSVRVTCDLNSDLQLLEGLVYNAPSVAGGVTFGFIVGVSPMF